MGFSNVTGDFIGIQDADIEDNPLEYVKLLVPMVEKMPMSCMVQDT